MADLPKFTLQHNPKTEAWDLKSDGSNRKVASFEHKADATKGGALSSALGSNGGSVKITKLDHTYQEERTYPRSADPKRSKG